MDVVETEQPQPSETASIVSYPSQDPSVIGELSRRQAGAEYLLLDTGTQLHACPITYPGHQVPLPDPGIHTASVARLQHDGGRLVTYKLAEGRTIQLLFHACAVQKPILSLGRFVQQEYWSDLRADTRTLFFPDKIQTRRSHTQLHREESLFFVKGIMVAPLTTAGVSDEVAQELQMPMGPQMLEDVEEPMPARPATLKDPGTPDQIVMEQHSLTHFPSRPWCKMCFESRGHDSPHREPSKNDAVVPQLLFDHGYMGNGGPLQVHLLWCRTPRRWTYPPLWQQKSSGCVTWGMNAFDCYWTEWQKNGVLKDNTGKFYDKCHRHRAIRAMEPLRKLSPQHVDSPEHIWRLSKTKSRFSQDTLRCFRDDQTRSMDSHEIQCEKRPTNDSVREASWTELQKRDSSTGGTSPRSPSWSECQSAHAALGNRPLAGTRYTG